MKKALSVIIILTFLSSTVFMVGCGGGGGGGIGAILGATVFVLAITASGPGGAAVFAANTRASLRPAISINTDNINMKITPLDAQGIKVTSSAITIASSSLNLTGTDITTQTNIDIANGYNQYLVEVFNGTNLLLQGIKYVHNSQKDGSQVAATVNTTTTAQFMTYNKWRVLAANAGATSYTYNDFSTNLQTDATSQANITSLKNDLDTELQTNGTTSDLSKNGFDVKANTAANGLSTTVPSEVVLVQQWDLNNSPMVLTDHEIFFDKNDWGPVVSSLIGLSFFKAEISGAGAGEKYVLGNYYAHKSTTTTSNVGVVAYDGAGVSELDQANTVPTQWFTNTQTAKGSDLAAGDVFYFRVQKENSTYIYGALKVETITTSPNEVLTFHYKYNRLPVTEANGPSVNLMIR